MTFEEYRKWHAGRWAQTTALAPYGDVRKLAIPSLGLPGETGEVLEFFEEQLRTALTGLALARHTGQLTEFFKKHVRDGKPLVGNVELKLEFGDAFNYLLELVHIAGMTFEEVLDGNVEKLTARDAGKRFG